MKKYFTRGLLASFIIANIFVFGFFANVTPVKAQSLTCSNLATLLAALGITSEAQINSAYVVFGCPTPVTPPVAPCYTFTRNLTIGSSGADVTALQNLLGITPATGYFGQIAKAAVMSFQVSRGIVPADGYVGPLTINVLNSMCGIPTVVVSPLQIELISQNIQQSGDGDTWYATGNFKFKATAVNDDVYIKNVSIANILDVLKSSVFVGSPSSVSLTSTADNVGDYYLVDEGHTETFTLSYGVYPTAGTGFYSTRATHLLLKDDQKVYLKGFESEKINLQGSSTTTPVIVPTATIIGSPTLKLSFDSARRESLLTANFKLSIGATSSDAFIPLNPFGVSMVNSVNNNSYSVQSTRIVNNITSGSLARRTIDDTEYYVIPAGTVANFDVTSTAKPTELFAGSYFARIYGYWIPKYEEQLKVFPAENASNKVTIIGEKSPYIKEVSTTQTSEGLKVSIKGVRLQNSSLVNSFGLIAADYWGAITSTDGTSISFMTKLPAGNYSVQVTDPKTGASNIVGFSVTGETPQPSLKPVITSVAAMAAENGEIDAGAKFGIQGTNLVYAGKDAVVYLVHEGGDKKFYATVTQYGSTLLYVTAPTDLYVGDYYNLYVSTDGGTSDPVRVKVLSSITQPSLPSAADINIVGSRSTYKPGQTIKYSVKTLTTDDRVGMPEQGFNVQWRLDSTDSGNATYNPATFLWEVKLKAPLDTSKNYTLDTIFYCSRPNQNLCAENQINKKFVFSLSPVPPPVTPSITVLSPNGGENIMNGSKYKIKWESKNLSKETLLNIWLLDEPTRLGNMIMSGVSNIGYVDNWIATAQTHFIDKDGNRIEPSGKYVIFIECVNGNCTVDNSDSYFKIVSPSTNKPPVISGLTAPTSLIVGEMGTWEFKAYDPENGPLGYSVQWSDSVSKTAPQTNSVNSQTVTLQHSYSSAGTYKIFFEVKDNGGLITKTTATVKVLTSPIATPVITPEPPATVSCGKLEVGSSLTPVQELLSCNNLFNLTMAADGNLVLYSVTKALWNTGTQGNKVSSVIMQGDGNLVIYNTEGKAIWATMKFGTPTGLYVQNDGNLVIYDTAGGIIWESKTNNMSVIGGSNNYATTMYSFESILNLIKALR